MLVVGGVRCVTSKETSGWTWQTAKCCVVEEILMAPEATITHSSTSRRQGILLLSSLVPSHQTVQVNKWHIGFLCAKSIEVILFVASTAPCKNLEWCSSCCWLLLQTCSVPEASLGLAVLLPCQHLAAGADPPSVIGTWEFWACDCPVVPSLHCPGSWSVLGSYDIFLCVSRCVFLRWGWHGTGFQVTRALEPLWHWHDDHGESKLWFHIALWYSPVKPE